MSLLDLQPHKVSRDLRGYSVLFYGEVKSGKTTTASKFPNALLLAFEKGYSALPGVFAKPMHNWSDFIKTLRELKDPAVKEKFETIVIDTADIAYEYVEEYICNINGVSSIADMPFGKGYTDSGKEFDSKLRQIVQMGYGLVLISHSQDKTFQNEDGTEYNKIVPTLSNKARLIASRLCDIIGYSRQVETPNGLETFLFMRGTPRFEAGSRFPYTSDKIQFSYKNLVEDIAQAIDKQAEEDNGEYITDERKNLYNDEAPELDFDALMKGFEEVTGWMIEESPEYFAPRITEVVEQHLGQGKKATECSRSQAMLLDLIVSELQNIRSKYKIDNSAPQGTD